MPQSWLDFIDETAAGTSAIGDGCFYAQQCVSGVCFQDVDGGFPYCSSDCVTTSDCPDDMACELERCVYPSPSPGAVGSDCATGVDCTSNVCTRAVEAEPLMCSKRCTPGKNQCPDGFACADDVAGEPSCLPGTEQDGCGCHSNSGGSVALALLIMLMVLRRQRASE